MYGDYVSLSRNPLHDANVIGIVVYTYIHTRSYNKSLMLFAVDVGAGGNGDP